MPRNFTENQNDLIDSIALSLDQLDGVLYLLINQVESDFQLIHEIKSFDVPIDPRIQSALHLANQLFEQTKSNFKKLTLGEN